MKKTKYLIVSSEQNNLGKLGDIVMISSGYARNYLIPRCIVVEANQREIFLFKQKQKQLKTKTEKAIAKAKMIVEQIKDIKLVIKSNTDKLGNLYGSISGRIISETLCNSNNINIDFRKFKIEQPIKTIGDFFVTVKLNSEVSCQLSISIIKNI